MNGKNASYLFPALNEPRRDYSCVLLKIRYYNGSISFVATLKAASSKY